MTKYPPEILIRPALSSEIEKLQSISKTTFISTYAAYNTPENMQLYLETHFNLDTLAKELDNDQIHYLFAIRDNDIIGYIKLNQGNAQTESKFPNTIEIERIYIINSEHGKGYGGLLLDKSVALAKEIGLQQIWLGVWDQNTTAITFYEKKGFYRDGIHSFILGDEPQRDYIMKLDL